MLDLAIGVIIGAAFGKIVTSLVGDILMPVVGLGLGKLDFSNFFISLNGQHYDTLADAKKAAAPTLNYGLFINYHDRIPDRRVGDFPDCEAGEPDVPSAAGRGACHQAMPGVL